MRPKIATKARSNQVRDVVKHRFITDLEPRLRDFLLSKKGEPVRSWTGERESIEICDLARGCNLYARSTVRVDVLSSLRNFIIRQEHAGALGDRGSKIQDYYHIQILGHAEKWSVLCGFSHMRKSFAEGAWSMLKAHYNQGHEHRLLRNAVVIDKIGKQTIKVN